MSTEESNVQPTQKPVMKPMDKHRPIIGEGTAPEASSAPAPSVLSAKDKHRPIVDPQ
ncbi:hypothetical protein ACFXN2_25580 [Streptomyces kronopolitis]|uniref:Uncharacterized protein n=1 Tax=Streptomyces kronopolitis TaxID=1612435 RepID=A0ABQ2K1P3_9ACTN|nr:hypothetical protein [Streptomyces kronopolitis]MCL6296809.1 hypothetical protein [Streptomyces kronopolitis]GGN60374.1 hypothetical protein GCM10012285_58340 [Streptomyces kronopolitis]